MFFSLEYKQKLQIVTYYDLGTLHLICPRSRLLYGTVGSVYNATDIFLLLYKMKNNLKTSFFLLICPTRFLHDIRAGK